jgi:hypothetical protein
LLIDYEDDDALGEVLDAIQVHTDQLIDKECENDDAYDDDDDDDNENDEVEKVYDALEKEVEGHDCI